MYASNPRNARYHRAAERDRKLHFWAGFTAGTIFTALFTIVCFILRDIAEIL